MKKILLALLFAISLTGCEWMNEDVKDFFKEYTETAAGELNEIQTYSVKDDEGYFNVPSDRDCVINCYLRNPQMYYFGNKETEDASGITLEYNGKDSDFSNQLLKSYPVTYVQKALATETIVITISADFLSYIENYINVEGSDFTLSEGKDISFDYSMVEPKSGRKFAGLPLKLRANSEPMAVKNLTVMRTNEDNPYYVLAFNMPDMTGIHKDICEISIESTGKAKEAFVVTPERDVAAASGIEYDNIKFLNSEQAATAVTVTEESNTFAGKGGDRVVYFKSAEPVSGYSEDKPCEFTVTLKDKIGLKAASSSSAFSLHLDGVTTEPEDLTGLTANEDGDGYSHFEIIAPRNTTYIYTKKDGSTIERTVDPSKITVYYIVYDLSGKVAKQGSGKDRVDVALGSGKWNVEAWAHYAGFIDSETMTTQAKATGAVYVDQSYTGEISDGGKGTPFTNFTDAFTQIKNSGFDDIQITLLSDYNMDEGKDFNLSDYGYTGSLTIEGKSKYSINRIATGSGDKIELRNVNTQKLKITSGTKIVLYGTTKPEEISVEKGAYIYVKNLSEREEGTTTVKVINDEKPDYGWNIITSYDNESYKPSEKEIYYFILNLGGYFINAELNDFGSYIGAVRISGISVKAPSFTGLCVMLYKMNGNAEESSFDSGAVLKAKEKIYAKVCKYDEASEIFVPIIEQNIKEIGLYDSGTAVAAPAVYSADQGYAIPEVIISGNYTIEVHFEYEKLEYTAQTLVRVEAE